MRTGLGDTRRPFVKDTFGAFWSVRERESSFKDKKECTHRKISFRKSFRLDRR